jgi:hypothetical protein
MGGEERPVRVVEQLQRRAGAGIDLQKQEILAVAQAVEGNEADKAKLGGHRPRLRFDACGERIGKP